MWYWVENNDVRGIKGSFFVGNIMSVRSEMRILTLQLLFGLDSRGNGGFEDIGASVLDAPFIDELTELDRKAGKELVVREGRELKDDEKRQAYNIARKAWGVHVKADELVKELAPGWPSDRQPGADRAIIRLSYYEMSSGTVPMKVSINEAVELAKLFGTERSPSFVNGVLDKMMRRLRDDGKTDDVEEKGES